MSRRPAMKADRLSGQLPDVSGLHPMSRDNLSRDNQDNLSWDKGQDNSPYRGCPCPCPGVRQPVNSRGIQFPQRLIRKWRHRERARVWHARRTGTGR